MRWEFSLCLLGRGSARSVGEDLGPVCRRERRMDNGVCSYPGHPWGFAAAGSVLTRAPVPVPASSSVFPYRL